ncbi:MAG: O-antigen ligase family protein [Holophagaceae bacterium]|nr:O-antigen ligase family protein [Holophagaceae bacterium]
MLVSLYFVITPIEDYLAGRLDNVLRVLSVIIAFGSLIEYARNKNSNFSIKPAETIIPIGLIVVANLSYFWAINPEFAAERNIAYTTLPLLFLVMTMRKYNEREIMVLDFSVIFSLLIIFYLLQSNRLSNTQIIQRWSISERNDPNALAANMTLPAVIALSWIYKDNLIQIWIGIIGMLAAFVVILLTGSRGGTVSFFIAAMVGIGYKFIKGRQIKITRLIPLLILAGFIGAALISVLPERILSLDQYTRDISQYESRTDIWSNLVNHVIPRLQIWGVGSGCAPILLIDFYGRMRGAHNTYLNILVEYGVFGLPLLLGLLWRVLKPAIKQVNFPALIALSALVMTSFFLDAYAKKYFWNILIYCYIRVYSYKE